MKIALPTKTSGEKSFVSEHFSQCNYFYIYDLETKEGFVYTNKFKNLEHGRGRSIVAFLKELNVSILIAKDVGTGAKAALGTDIAVFKATDEIVLNNIESYKENKLVTL